MNVKDQIPRLLALTHSITTARIYANDSDYSLSELTDRLKATAVALDQFADDIDDDTDDSTFSENLRMHSTLCSGLALLCPEHDFGTRRDLVLSITKDTQDMITTRLAKRFKETVQLIFCPDE